ncbi:hypothetical protein THASP1DRAFT_26302 [Thamnocephalis sphaerospora]|uniref:Uncharacterized protein n=1 Tax=Thamnocephalis sphaerospora TaxID=78915 RepID=A0A4P9XHI4_9FUNG|nr:hypothetical protein THASP1DRAFT_26302 [Thamnocephalis sphaerospora]|eukprot:RKP05155.1 hypothetical protein THASP1DRAFT_26302 [Thamnocephalis sphaerospora]
MAGVGQHSGDHAAAADNDDDDDDDGQRETHERRPMVCSMPVGVGRRQSGIGGAAWMLNVLAYGARKERENNKQALAGLAYDWMGRRQVTRVDGEFTVTMQSAATYARGYVQRRMWRFSRSLSQVWSAQAASECHGDGPRTLRRLATDVWIGRTRTPRWGTEELLAMQLRYPRDAALARLP